MLYRQFGNTDMHLSEYGFGAWGIGGQSYGYVLESDAIKALHIAEEYGCNFIDTAGVYGDSEKIIGKFISNRRDNWLISSKYSGQESGMIDTIEKQLNILQTDYIDFYQIHWAPSIRDSLYDDLQKIKQDGKCRYIGVSLYNQQDINQIVDMDFIDGFQVAFNLLEPLPFTKSLEQIKKNKKGVLIRSSLKSGFLTGKYNNTSKFDDPKDQRSKLNPNEITKIINQIRPLRFLGENHESLLHAAARYPLFFPESTCVLLGTKTAEQAKVNFYEVPLNVLSEKEIEEIYKIQKNLGLLKEKPYSIQLLQRIKNLIKLKNETVN